MPSGHQSGDSAYERKAFGWDDLLGANQEAFKILSPLCPNRFAVLLEAIVPFLLRADTVDPKLLSVLKFVFQTCILSLPILAKSPNGGITRWCDPRSLEGGPGDAVVIAKTLLFPTNHLSEHFGGKDPIDRMLTGSVSSSANEGPKT